MNVKEASSILGGNVSKKNSKMPGTSFGLSTDYCNVGGILRGVEGSVCSKCYARRLENLRPSVKQGWTNRAEAVLKATQTTQGMAEWVTAMIYLLKRYGEVTHRWHDSGDLLNDNHLSMIVTVARACPEIKMWLPTKERAIVKRALKVQGSFPPNLCVRVSASQVNAHLPMDDTPTSMVIDKETRVFIESTGTACICPAPEQGNQCLGCRMCWDKSIATVAYIKH